MKTTIAALLLAPALLLSGCVTTQHYSRSLDGPSAYDSQPWERTGRVEHVREHVRRTQGDPGGGAVAGALFGGLLGHALTGDGGGAVVGAIGGAMAGAAASQGSAEERWYEVYVRFDDGSLGRFAYHNPPPWRVGDPIRQTGRGLERGRAPSPRSDAPSERGWNEW